MGNELFLWEKWLWNTISSSMSMGEMVVEYHLKFHILTLEGRGVHYNIMFNPSPNK